ncbi:MAG: MBL fold metallo-hydrolase [Acidimicrobiales bacterium]
MARNSRPEHPMLTFLGGAGTVTGSRFLIETPVSTVLVDCGLFQGLKDLRLRNWQPFPYDPKAIDAVVITHAHIDHIGYLPKLVQLGFRGKVYCTQATADLAAIVLPDSGHLQEEEAAFANRTGYSKHQPALALYTEDEAKASLRQLRAVDFGAPTLVTADVTVTLRPAGHILGASTATVELAPSGRRIVFSGDLGRPSHPLLVPPESPSDADMVVMESTYGGRQHDDEGAIDEFASVITRTARRGGSIVIPAFAVDRTEVVLHWLRELMATERVPQLPVYVDSPMALRALGVYRRAIGNGSAEVRSELRGGPDPFDTGQLHEVRSVEESKALADITYPSIIVSASGMATGGRVLHHLARLLPDRRNAVVLVGFQAAGTRGRRLAEGETEIKMFGRYLRVRAEVVSIGSFSVHADHGELMQWLGAAEPPPETVFLVHGESDGAEALKTSIRDDLDVAAVVARPMERVRLD